jgi:tetratricopeptide (TPR) repeat protein
MTATTFVDYYELLQIAQTASLEEVKSAISHQRRIWIKRQASADPQRRAEAETRVRRLDEAERVLLSPAQRRDYDRQLPERRGTDGRPEIGADSATGWVERARTYLDGGNVGAAHRAAREATNQRGGDHEAWYVRAHSSFLLGQVTDAEFEFAEAIRIAPEEPDYHHDLGEVYLQQEKWPLALREFEIALRLSPDNPVTRTGIAQVMLGTEQPARALEIMEAVVRDNPRNQSFKYYLGAALEAVARSSMTLLRDGSIVVTSATQAELLEHHANRIAKLRLVDEDASLAVAELRRMATDARQLMWIHSQSWQVYAFVLVALVCGMFGGLGSGSGGGVAFGLLVAGPLAAGVIYMYVARHRKPAYEHAAKSLGGQVARWGV